MRSRLSFAVAVTLAVPGLAQAVHLPYGSGCRDLATGSFGAFYPDATAAAAALSGRSLVLTPHERGYRITWDGAALRSPGAAAVALPPSDDGQAVIYPSTPLPTPDGPLAALWVHSNGFVAGSAANDGGAWNEPPVDYLPSPLYRNAPAAAFWAWHDWNPAEPGSGRIVHEEVLLAGERTLCVTWHDVENFPAGQVNRGTFQFQLGLVTGRVAYVWAHVDATTSSVFGSAHLVGWSPGGASLDAGLRVLPQDLPWITAPDRHALALHASPAPVSNGDRGTVVTYTTEPVPPIAADSEERLGITVLSLAQAPGIDLGPFGMPDCRAYVQSFDLQLPWQAVTAMASASLALPPNLPDGLAVFAQSLALVEPAPSGTLGIWTSNGVASRIAPH